MRAVKLRASADLSLVLLLFEVVFWDDSGLDIVLAESGRGVVENELQLLVALVRILAGPRSVWVDHR